MFTFYLVHTVFPHIVSAEFFEFGNPKVHKCAETIQGRKLYEEIRYFFLQWTCRKTMHH